MGPARHEPIRAGSPAWTEASIDSRELQASAVAATTTADDTTARDKVHPAPVTGDGFRRAFQNAVDGLLLVGPDGRVRDCNQAFAAPLGFAPAELLGLPIAEFSAPQDRSTDADVARDLRDRASRFVRRDKRFLDADGTPVPAVVTSWLLPTTEPGDFDVVDRVEWSAPAVLGGANPLETQFGLDAIISVDSVGRVVSWNGGAAGMFGWTAEEMFGRGISTIFPGQNAALYERAVGYVSGDGSRLIGTARDVRARRRNGEEFPIELSLSSWESDGEQLHRAILRDVTAARRTSELAALVQQAASIANDCERLEDAIARLLPALGSAGRASAARGWLGEAGAEPPIAHWTASTAAAAHRTSTGSAKLANAAGRANSAGSDPAAIRVVPSPDGVVLQIPILLDGRVCGVLELDRPSDAGEDPSLHSSLMQVSVQLGRVAERDRSAAELRRRSLTDPLTGLGNVWQAEQLLAAEVQRVRDGHPAVVVLLDLDKFRDVNDSVGFVAGNEILRAVAARLTTQLRRGDALVRLGGDEFLVICSEIPDEILGETVARRIVDCFGEPFRAAGAALYLGASVGVVTVTPNSTPEMLVGFGEISMYRAKLAGGSRYVVFDKKMETEVRSRLQTQRALREALGRHELVLHYQPVIRPADGAVTGLEALVRWNRPGHGLVPPLDFIPVAEQSGLIVPLGRQVLFEATRQMAEWRRLWPELDGTRIAVNIAAAQLTPDFPALVMEVLATSGLPAERLTLEITEGVLLLDIGRTGDLLRGLREMGVTIALDDFGTGYSSLSYLRQLPVDVLKMDRSFVEPFGTSASADAFVDVVVDLAHALDLTVVAEGVETADQACGLTLRHCDGLQGYYYSRPVAGPELPGVLERLRAGALPVPAPVR